MCHRYSLGNIQYVKEKYPLLNADLLSGYKPNYNISPGSFAPVIIKIPAGYYVRFMKWGLVPKWAKDPSIGIKLSNARAESLNIKPSFRNSLKDSRCIIPAEGFYEWEHKGNEKIPHFIYSSDSNIIPMAGLYGSWKDQAGNTLESFTIITKGAEDGILKIHSRMPVVMDDTSTESWLNHSTEAMDVLIKAQRKLNIKQISKEVNNPRNNLKFY